MIMLFIFLCLLILANLASFAIGYVYGSRDATKHAVKMIGTQLQQ